MKFPVILSGISIGFVICLLPSLAHAFDFYTLERGQVLEAGSAIYRLRANQPPQLAELPEGAVITQSVSFNDRLVAVGQTTEQFLIISQDGLLWQKISTVIPATNLALTIFHDQLFLLHQSASATELLTSSDGLVFSTTNTAALPSPPELDHLLWIDQKVVLAFQNLNEIDLFTLVGGVWQNTASVTCPTAKVFHQPVDFLFCQDGRVLVPQTISQWLNLFGVSVSQPSVSADLIVAPTTEVENIPPQLAIWQKGQASTWLVTSRQTNLVAALSVSGLRVLVRFTARGWDELLWQPAQPEFSSITTTGTDVPFETSNNPRLFISSGTGGFYSDEPGVWLPITTPASSSFNHASRVPGGWLVWKTSDDQTTGGLTLFAPDSAPDTYVKVNRWSSTTSPVQAFDIGSEVSYIAVINSSSRLNLYRTSNFTDWTLVTLPSAITFVRTPAGARLLAEGSLVECRAVIRVLPMVVNAETLYIQDQTGGIQVFLDSSNGQLSSVVGQEVFATGTISSSQAKRIVIDDPIALEVISQDNPDPDWPTIAPADIATYQGQVAWVKGEVTDIQTDWWQLGSDTATLKIHVQTGSKPVKGDTIKVKAVVDWNSASGAVEGWALDSTFVVIDHPTPSPTPTVQPSPSPSPGVSPTPTSQPTIVVGGSGSSSTPKPVVKSATKTAAQPQVVTASTTQPNLVSAITSENPIVEAFTPDQSQQGSANPLTTLLLLASSLVTGLLIGQGWRIRLLLDHTDTS